MIISLWFKKPQAVFLCHFIAPVMPRLRAAAVLHNSPGERNQSWKLYWIPSAGELLCMHESPCFWNRVSCTKGCTLFWRFFRFDPSKMALLSAFLRVGWDVTRGAPIFWPENGQKWLCCQRFGTFSQNTKGCTQTIQKPHYKAIFEMPKKPNTFNTLISV